jgi:hypothetical protein
MQNKNPCYAFDVKSIPIYKKMPWLVLLITYIVIYSLLLVLIKHISISIVVSIVLYRSIS